MANFTPTKKQVSDFNNGIKYVNKVDTPSADDFNNVIESQLYSQNFAESIADTPDTSEASQVGVPSVTLINNIKNGVAYKKFKFANMKGDTGGVAPVENSQSNNTNTVPSSKLLKESSFARVYREKTDFTYDNATVTFPDFAKLVTVDFSKVAIRLFGGDLPLVKPIAGLSGTLYLTRVAQDAVYGKWITSGRSTTDTRLYNYETYIALIDTNDKWCGWKRIISTDDISTVAPISSAAASDSKVYSEKLSYYQLALKAPTNNPTFTGTVTVPAPTNPTDAARLQDVTGLSAGYDKVIRTQAEFETLISSPTWIGAQSVALVGAFSLSTANNSGIKIPATVKQIHGFNSAKITVTNFVYNSSTAKGGLWYDTAPTTNDYSICDLAVDCTGSGNSSGYGFRNCTNLTNCTGTGTGSYGYGFSYCINLTNCTGTGTGTAVTGYGFFNCTNLTNCTGTGTGGSSYGFGYCINLTNCTGTGTGTAVTGYGFFNCTNLTNCTGTGIGSYGYGFGNINYAVNCKDGGSSTGMWGGTNKNIDIETCRKTPVTADNTTLNT